MFSVAQEQVAEPTVEPMLFDQDELDLGQYPGVVRRVVITEHSEELARIGEANARSHRIKPTPESSDPAQRDSDRFAHRSLVASIINCAITDIQLALRQKDPRTLEISQRGGTKRLHNYAFDSALRFIFGQEEITVSDRVLGERQANFSPFGAYCSLMGWSAPVFRGRILKIFPDLERFLPVVLDEKMQLAPIVPVQPSEA